MIYFHGNGEDLSKSQDMLLRIKYALQVHIIAVEYPGYGVYQKNTIKQKDSKILQDA